MKVYNIHYTGIADINKYDNYCKRRFHKECGKKALSGHYFLCLKVFF
jgi:hypothetical protein